MPRLPGMTFAAGAIIVDCCVAPPEPAKELLAPIAAKPALSCTHAIACVELAKLKPLSQRR